MYLKGEYVDRNGIGLVVRYTRSLRYDYHILHRAPLWYNIYNKVIKTFIKR